MTDALKKEYTLRISQANKTEMIVILYEITMSYVKDAQKAIGQEKESDFRPALRKARSCVSELMDSLHMEYEIANNLNGLYHYIIREMNSALTERSGKSLDHVLHILEELHEAYGNISGQDSSQPVMENTQAVYAGLTYGKNNLTENLARDPADRGFLI